MRLVTILVAFQFPFITSQAQTLREVFTAMPDSLTPCLTANNRLDMMDFMDAKMKAAVTNKLGGESLMTFLSNDSLAIRMSEALTIELKMLTADTMTVVDMKHTYNIIGGQQQTLLTRYNAKSWQVLLPARLIESTLNRFDERAKQKDPNERL